MRAPRVTSKGEATRRRVLDAATTEFARFGIAGARVDRIAEAASTNKAQLYSHFMSKDLLFDEVFAESMRSITEVVPISADDLADWALRLYDEYLERPELIRLATWARLERRPSGHLVPDADRIDAVKLDAIAEAQTAGRVRDGIDPFDVMAMVIAMSMAWSPVSNVYAATTDEEPSLHRARRRLLADSVRRALSPEEPPPPPRAPRRP